MYRKRERMQGILSKLLHYASPHPSGGFTEFILMYRQVASFKEMGVSVCVCSCVWSNMAQLLQANCLALESETGCVHGCV